MVKERTALTGPCLSLVIIGLLFLSVAGNGLPFPWIAFLTIPAFVAFLLVLKRKRFGVYGVPPILLFWLLFMFATIWWDLLGRQSRHYSITEIVLSVILGVLCGWGTFRSFLEAAGGDAAARVLGFVVFLGSQAGLFWLSFYFDFGHTGAA
jgi:hypothetical protein